MAPCPPLAQVSGTTVTMGALLQTTVATASAYHECRARHQALVDWATQ